MDLGGRGEDSAYSYNAAQIGFGASGSQQELTANFARGSKRKLNRTMQGSWARSLAQSGLADFVKGVQLASIKARNEFGEQLIHARLAC